MLRSSDEPERSTFSGQKWKESPAVGSSPFYWVSRAQAMLRDNRANPLGADWSPFLFFC